MSVVLSTRQRRVVAGALALATGLSLVACTATPDAGPEVEFDPTLEVTLTIGDLPPEANEASRAQFLEQVEAFQLEYPHITLNPIEETWDPQTFQAKLAGGNLPDVMFTAVTEAASIASRQQVANLNDALRITGLDEALNPDLVATVTGPDGGIYAIPTGVGPLGIIYNRVLFEQAGLDPDVPPATWDEVREYAKLIVERTDAKTGFTPYATQGTGGGWMLAAGAAGFGGSLVSDDGTEATLTSQPVVDFLTLYRDMRWEDNTVGEMVVFGGAESYAEFSADQVGMMIGHNGMYEPIIVRNEADPAIFGMGPMPVGGGATPGTLSGGGIQIVSPTTTLEEQVAAVQWINYRHLRKFTDQAFAVDQAQAAAESGASAHIPGYAPVSEEQYELYLEWIAPYNNVPIEQFAPFLNSRATYELRGEPALKTQEIYAETSVILQRILEDESADPMTVLEEANTAVARLLAR